MLIVDYIYQMIPGSIIIVICGHCWGGTIKALGVIAGDAIAGDAISGGQITGDVIAEGSIVGGAIA